MLYLKEHRQIRQLTQEKLAQQCGLSQATISNIERGEANPTYQTLNKIAACLNMNVNNLFILPYQQPKLNRFEIDEIARYIINGEVPLDTKKAQLVKDLALLETQKLAAVNKPGRLFAKANRWNTKSRYLKMKKNYSEEVIFQVLNRVDKLLALEVTQ